MYRARVIRWWKYEMDKLIKVLRNYLSLVNKSGADFFRPDVLNLYHVLANAELDYRMKQKEPLITDEDWTKFKLSLFKQEPKMTREEAVKKVKDCGDIYGKGFINALEAIGLIKFDEPKLILYRVKTTHDVECGPIELDEIKKALSVAGYEIVKKP